MKTTSGGHKNRERRLEKVACRPCAGTGKFNGPKWLACRTCGGNGWVAPVAGQEQLCPECNGDGVIQYKDNGPCPACGGKGYEVRIIEIIPNMDRCYECDGQGQTTENMVCGECEGSGTNRFTLADGSKCEKCEGTGEVIQSTVCPTCNGVGEFECASFETEDVTPKK